MFETRWRFRLVVLAASALLVALGVAQGVVARSQAQPQEQSGGPCSGGKGDKDRNAPIVCVDDTGEALSVDPDPFYAYDVKSSDKKPVVIQWFTVSGGNDLQIEMKPGCTTSINCNGRGKCTAKTVAFKKGETGEKRCKYDVWTDKHPRLDPESVIVRCCPAP